MGPGLRRQVRALPAALGIGLLVGCTGGGAVYTVPLMRSDFQPGEPPISAVAVPEAYYWTGDDGTLNVALRYQARSLLGHAFDTEWLMSIVLDAPPAGSAKLYPLTSRDIRMVQSHGGDHRRARSVRGVVVIEAPKEGQLNGQFHAWVRQQRFGVLTGWAPPINRAPMLIMAGRFQAVAHAERGREILTRTEADGFDRPPAGAPTTRPIRWLHRTPATAPGS